MNYQVTESSLHIYLEGRITSDNAPKLEKEIGALIEEHPGRKLFFDADRLEYISSAGLRFVLRFAKSAPEKITIENVSREVYEIFDVTGFCTLMQVQKKLRQVSIEELSQVGTGLSSKVYRIDEDTIIKVYDEKVPFYKITREIDLAKKAFLAGIPTPISYDLVRCGNTYGVVFEMIANAVTVGDALMAQEGKDFEPIMEKFAALLKLMHQTKIDKEAGFPSIKGTWLEWAEGMRKYYTDQEHALLEKMILQVPDADTIVHCDFHAGNTLYQNGEIVVIDMADVGYAHPVFDFAAGAFHTLVSHQENIQHSLSLSQAYIVRFWHALLANYFGTRDEAKLSRLKEIFNAFALLRAALFPMKHVQIPEESKKFFVENARKNFFPRIDWAMEQARALKKLEIGGR